MRDSGDQEGRAEDTRPFRSLVLAGIAHLANLHRHADYSRMQVQVFSFHELLLQPQVDRSMSAMRDYHGLLSCSDSRPAYVPLRSPLRWEV